MEDFIKKNIQGYKPEFKPEYWNEASKLLQRKRRRRLLFLWLSSGLVLMLLSLVTLYFLMPESEIRNQDGIQTEKISAKNKKRTLTQKSNNLEEITSESKTTYGSTSATELNTKKSNVSEDPSQTAKKGSTALTSSQESSVSSNPIRNQKQTGHTALLSPPIESTNENTQNEAISRISTSVNNIKDDRIEPEFVLQPSPSDSKVEFDPDRLQKANRLELEKSFEIDLVQPIEILTIEDFRINQRPLTLATNISPMVIQQRELLSPASHFRLAVSGQFISGSEFGTGNKISLNLQHTLPFSSSLPISLVLGAHVSRYAQGFGTIEEHVTAYRSFARNSLKNSIELEEAYYAGVDVQLESQLGKWVAGISFRPEAQLGLYGKITNTHEEDKLTALSTSPDQSEYVISTTTATTSKSNWLDTDNTRFYNIPAGLYIQRKLSSTISVGLVAESYLGGLIKLKQPVRGSSYATGASNSHSGGIYVSYEF